jgi:hypothetical protein
VTALASYIALALAVALVVGGALSAFASSNALKRVAAVVIALFGAALALGALGAPAIGVVGAVAIAFGYAVAGVSIVVLLQETYGSVEVRDVDAADERDEPQEQET